MLWGEKKRQYRAKLETFFIMFRFKFEIFFFLKYVTDEISAIYKKRDLIKTIGNYYWF